MTRKHFITIKLIIGLAFVAAAPLAKGDWRVVEHPNPLGPGKVVDVLHDGKAVARLVHGDGQIKPFLHIFGGGGELVTNPGIDKEGNAAGLFSHHRGIFIGWNKISSELGKYDMWHRGGPGNGRYDIVKFENTTTEDYASIVAHIKWRATKKDASGSDVMITERRTFNVSRPGGKYTQVDASFELKAERDIGLAGDLQHAGVHFRAHTSVATRNKETSYLWEPANAAGKGKVIDFKVFVKVLMQLRTGSKIKIQRLSAITDIRVFAKCFLWIYIRLGCDGKHRTQLVVIKLFLMF